MKTKTTVMVRVLQTQDNPNELFEKWNTNNTNNINNIKCSKVDCNNASNNKAYLVSKLKNSKDKFIIPLCEECYKLVKNDENYSNSDPYNFGAGITILKDLLLEYGE